MIPFSWLDDATSLIAAGTSSQNAVLKRAPTGAFQLRVFNAGPDTAYLQKGLDATVQAQTDDLPIPAGALEVFTLHSAPAAPITHIAAITASGAASVYLTVGAGL